jgi:hypothetical protein
MGNLSFELPDGEIMAAGKLRIRVLRSETGDEVAITGGTGAYSHASGVLTIGKRIAMGDLLAGTSTSLT